MGVGRVGGRGGNQGSNLQPRNGTFKPSCMGQGSNHQPGATMPFLMWKTFYLNVLRKQTNQPTNRRVSAFPCRKHQQEAEERVSAPTPFLSASQSAAEDTDNWQRIERPLSEAGDKCPWRLSPGRATRFMTRESLMVHLCRRKSFSPSCS